MVDAEELFGQLVVDLGLARPDEVKECLDLLRNNRNGTRRLAHILIEKGYLDMEKVDRTVALSTADKTVLQTSATPPPSLPEPEEVKGEPFGKYIKTRILGAGGMGEVWKAWDTELRRWVAIKFFRGVGNEKDLARFRREAQTAAKLDHPGITSVYEAGEDHIFMQFVDGNSLSSFPRGDHRRIASVMKLAAEALHYAHQNGIIHRDIKPANILFAEGETPIDPFQVFLTDFGLAKPMEVDSSLSLTGDVIGTPGYMSPEQAEGHRRLDNRSDIYSLGSTLYYLLAGRAPFSGESAYKVVRKVIEDDPLPFRADVPPDLATITFKCMEKDPAARYPNALEVAAELGRFQNHEPIHARPISRAESAWRTVRKYRAVLIPSTVAGLLAISILGWTGTSAWLRAREVRGEIAHTRAYMSQATGEARERLKLYRLASRTIDGALAISPGNGEALSLRTQITATIEKIGADAEAYREQLEGRLARKRDLMRMARVLGGWERLHETLEELEEIHFDSTLSEEEKSSAQEESWKKIAGFKKRLPDDPASRSMGLALTGWSRVIAGEEKEGISWLNEARRLNPENPYGFFLKALLRFEEILNDHPFAEAGSIGGVRWWTSSEPEATRAQVLSLLENIRSSTLWVQESGEDYHFAMTGMTAFVRGNYGKAESAFDEAIAAPELIVFQADFRLARAQARLHRKNYEGALSDLEELRDARPRQSLVPFLMGMAHSALSEKRPMEAGQVRQRRGEAILDFEKAGSLSKNCWQAWVRAGALHEAEGRKEQAANSYLQALNITVTMNPKPELPKVRAAIERVTKK